MCTVALCDDISICIDLSAHKQEVDVLLRKLDPDLDGRVSIREFKKVLCGSTPITCSTPVRQADLRAPHKVRRTRSEKSLQLKSELLKYSTKENEVTASPVSITPPLRPE